jgi:hypothetical protein
MLRRQIRPFESRLFRKEALYAAKTASCLHVY